MRIPTRSALQQDETDAGKLVRACYTVGSLFGMGTDKAAPGTTTAVSLLARVRF